MAPKWQTPGSGDAPEVCPSRALYLVVIEMAIDGEAMASDPSLVTGCPHIATATHPNITARAHQLWSVLLHRLQASGILEERGTWAVYLSPITFEANSLAPAVSPVTHFLNMIFCWRRHNTCDLLTEQYTGSKHGPRSWPPSSDPSSTSWLLVPRFPGGIIKASALWDHGEAVSK